MSSHDDESLCSFSVGTNNDDGDGDKTANDEQEQVIGKQETRFVQAMRLLVLFVLAGATAGAGYSVYWFLDTSETDDFREDFVADAGKVMASIGQNLDRTLTALDSFVVTMVSYAKDTNSTWPQVTIPDFEVRASKIRALSKGVYLNNYMLIDREEREEWENYAEQNGGWVEESIAIQKTDSNYYGPFIDDYYIVRGKCQALNIV
jgi:hypothetical protein